MIGNSEPDFSYLRFLPLLCIGLLLTFTFRLYTFAYFWLDDFNNLYWVQPQNFRQMIGHVINPTSDFFRPTGMLFYWAALQLFDRNALAYHCLLWTLHAVNVGMVYWLLRRFTGSRAGAAVGAMLFSSQYMFNDLLAAGYRERSARLRGRAAVAACARFRRDALLQVVSSVFRYRRAPVCYTDRIAAHRCGCPTSRHISSWRSVPAAIRKLADHRGTLDSERGEPTGSSAVAKQEHSVHRSAGSGRVANQRTIGANRSSIPPNCLNHICGKH